MGWGEPQAPRPVVPVGWRCPDCGACYAPHVVECHHCEPQPKPLRERVRADTTEA